MSATLTCRECQAEMASTDRYCPSCGHDTELDGDLAALDLKVRQARGWILAVGIIYAVSAVLMLVITFLLPRIMDEREKSDAERPAGNYFALARQMRQSSRPGTFSAAELDLYRQAWAQPGALTAMLNWYRALFQTTPQTAITNLVQMPTLVIWGKQDKFMQAEMAQQSIEYCVNGRLIYFDNATHWVMHEEADKVNNCLLDFLLDEQE